MLRLELCPPDRNRESSRTVASSGPHQFGSLCATWVGSDVGVASRRRTPSSAGLRADSRCWRAERKTMHICGVLFLLCVIPAVPSQQWKQETPGRYPKDAKPCTNLTQILDNWKFAILSQLKELLINDHASVLPEYSRIGPLSDALRELHGRFDTLKDDLAGLTAKLDGVEAFVDRAKDGGVAPCGRPAAGLRSARMRPLRAIAVRGRGPHRP
ncbi:uncharacterized protein LOC133513923 [Syngnathoides biaculeatus]|uniref:uncharacterized protein LOC133513923 n=1 Tax=Syngnathoides biaculeatus TaxID=300417 RepID=UPI002ADD7A17|nr:uncharacterized protein LOC133513923 [Syngnathoides biaculeatus]